MGYLHIPNLYRPEGQEILLFKECYALEKLHGTSANLSWKTNPSNKEQRQLTFHPGGESYNNFVALFDKDVLIKSLTDLGIDPDKEVGIYGEAYGGRQQKMSGTYGIKLKFAVFDIQIGDCWLSVPQADELAKKLGLEFVHYVKVSTDLASLDAVRDMPSVQAIRNGVSTFVSAEVGGVGFTSDKPFIFSGELGGYVIDPKKREGVVLRPLIEVRLNDHIDAGNRLICKHKGDDFKETATPRAVVDPTQMKVLEDANAVADEWVVMERLSHVLDKIPGHSMEKMRDIIFAMTEDVFREGKGEFIESEAVKKAIGKKTVEMYKVFLKSQILAK